MTALAFLKDWSEVFAPWAAIGVTLWVAMRVQAVHKLVNSEMDEFRATLQRLADANATQQFQHGQQSVRDTNRTTVADAAKTTLAAAEATTAAAGATTAAANAVSQNTPVPPRP
jgi:hypothetical protein